MILIFINCQSQTKNHSGLFYGLLIVLPYYWLWHSWSYFSTFWLAELRKFFLAVQSRHGGRRGGRRMGAGVSMRLGRPVARRMAQGRPAQGRPPAWWPAWRVAFHPLSLLAPPPQRPLAPRDSQPLPSSSSTPPPPPCRLPPTAVKPSLGRAAATTPWVSTLSAPVGNRWPPRQAQCTTDQPSSVCHSSIETHDFVSLLLVYSYVNKYGYIAVWLLLDSRSSITGYPSLIFSSTIR
jgi:hypothetical protein